MAATLATPTKVPLPRWRMARKNGWNVAASPVPESRMVSFRVAGATARDGPYLIHNEPVWNAGAPVGHVTSGGWGWRLGAMVGLATLHRAGGVTAAWLVAGAFTVQIAGQHHPLTVQLAVFYDPAGEIMRG